MIEPLSATLNDSPSTYDLVLLSGEDEGAARTAFDRLWKATLAPLMRLARRRGLREADAEDLSQVVLTELWGSRRSVRAQTSGAWYGLVWTAATRKIAKTPSPHGETLVGEIDDIPAEDLPYLDALLDASEERRRLYEKADDLWLGDVDEDVAVRIVALQFLLIDGLDKEDIAMMLGILPDEIEGWIHDPAVLARALFSAVCWPSDHLAGHLLRPERPFTPSEMDTLLRDQDAHETATVWPRKEARVLCWRIRYGLPEERILRAAGGEVDRPELDDALAKIQAAFPYRRIAQGLRTELEERGDAGAMARSGLWMRVAFEYATRYDLPPRQVLERAGPPAAESRFHLDMVKLYNWLSAGRLYSQLAHYLQGDDE